MRIGPHTILKNTSGNVPRFCIFQYSVGWSIHHHSIWVLLLGKGVNLFCCCNNVTKAEVSILSFLLSLIFIYSVYRIILNSRSLKWTWWSDDQIGLLKTYFRHEVRVYPTTVRVCRNKDYLYSASPLSVTLLTTTSSYSNLLIDSIFPSAKCNYLRQSRLRWKSSLLL